jgi:hypothetical protein
MTQIVQDISRPDKNGVAPKMQTIADLLREKTAGLLPHLTVTTDDNLCSSVCLRGSLQAPEEWAYGIFHNSPGFILFVRSKGKRYYEDQDILEAEVSYSSKLPKKFRKCSGTAEKVAAKVREWIREV